MEISQSRAFSIVFGVAFMLLSAALIWRGWQARTERLKATFVCAFALLVFAAAVSAFCVTNDALRGLSPAAKVPLFSLLGIALSFALTFCFTELINADLCRSCRGADDADVGLIASRRQLAALFIGALALGALFGILFGVLDVEKDNPQRSKFNALLLWAMLIGGSIGGATGLTSEYIRQTHDPTGEQRPILGGARPADQL